MFAGAAVVGPGVSTGPPPKKEMGVPTMIVSASHFSVSRMKGSQTDSRARMASGIFSNRTSETPSILDLGVVLTSHEREALGIKLESPSL